MGQTLNHGVYLPAEGERNCYSGLASNWNLLDTAIGDIAGKASATHTHGNITNDGKVGTTANLPLITGTGGAITAGAFGNQANTFCEGNDSRLSDARTPVAHTHTKSDVTDLLNSNFTPSANNSYDLGSSSYQWNNLYAKNYYYNGVAWGLDKENTWTVWQTLEHTTEALIRLKRSNLQIGDPIPASQQTIGTIPFADKNNLNLGLIACRDNTNGDTYLTLTIRQRYDSNGRANNGTQYESRIDLGVDSSHNLYLRPNSNGQINLGTSTNRWKTLNGINPGALSLPNLASDGYIDLSDNISANTEYLYTPTVDGWLALYCQTTGFHAENAVGIFTGGGQNSSYRWACSATSAINLPRAAKYHGAVMLPVKAGLPYLCWITINSSTTLSAKRLYFYKATGNV